MQREPKSPGLAGKPFLAGVLAVLLLAVGILVVSGPLHQALHHEQAAGVTICAVCLWQHVVDLPAVSLVVVPPVFFLLRGLWVSIAAGPWGDGFLLPPGRAPPGSSHTS